MDLQIAIKNKIEQKAKDKLNFDLAERYGDINVVGTPHALEKLFNSLPKRDQLRK